MIGMISKLSTDELQIAFACSGAVLLLYAA
jgi:hypothetical protein